MTYWLAILFFTIAAIFVGIRYHASRLRRMRLYEPEPDDVTAEVSPQQIVTQSTDLDNASEAVTVNKMVAALAERLLMFGRTEAGLSWIAAHPECWTPEMAEQLAQAKATNPDRAIRLATWAHAICLRGLPVLRADAAIRLADLMAAGGRIDGAVEFLVQEYETHPDDQVAARALLLRSRAGLLLRRGDIPPAMVAFEAAACAFETAERFADSWVCRLELVRTRLRVAASRDLVEELWTVLRGLIHTDAPAPARAIAHATIAGHLDDNPNSALGHMKLACELAGTDGEVMFFSRLAECQAAVGLLDDAIETWRQYLLSYPDDTTARYNLGVALDMVERGDEAAEQYRKVLVREPYDWKAAHNLAVHHREASRFQEAHDTLSMLLDVHGRNPVLYYELSQLSSMQGEHGRAVGLLKTAITVDQTYTSAYVTLARFALAAGDPEECLEILVRCEASCSLDESEREKLRVLRHKASGTTQTRTRDVMEVPRGLKTILARIEAMVDESRLHEALTASQEATRMFPGEIEPQLFLAYAFRDLGYLDDARRVALGLLEHAPTDPRIVVLVAKLEVMDGSAAYRQLRDTLDNRLSPPENFILVAAYAMQRGERDAAQRALSLLARRYPTWMGKAPVRALQMAVAHGG